MKTTFISLTALGVAAAMAGPADRALADGPMVLTDAQLDQVTAGHIPSATLIVRKAGGDSPVEYMPSAGVADITFEPAREGETLHLELETRGTLTSPHGVVVVSISDPSSPR